MKPSFDFINMISTSVLLLTLTSPFSAFCAPSEPQAPNNLNKHALEVRAALPDPVPGPDPLSHSLPNQQEADSDLSKRDPAGLRWGPVYVGNLKLYLTNPHVGPVGPKFPGDVPHVNFHVDKKAAGPRGNYVPVINAHIVKYENAAGSSCLYIWDSVTRKILFDECFDDFSTAVGAAVRSVKETVERLLGSANAVASVAIIAALVVALTAALGGLAVVAV